MKKFSKFIECKLCRNCHLVTGVIYGTGDDNHLSWPRGHKTFEYEYSKIVQSEPCICWIWNCNRMFLSTCTNSYLECFIIVMSGLTPSCFGSIVCQSFCYFILICTEYTVVSFVFRLCSFVWKYILTLILCISLWHFFIQATVLY